MARRRTTLTIFRTSSRTVSTFTAIYEITEEMREYSVPYETILPILTEHGCTAYINSEYEGQRWTQDVYETDSCELIRRHHVMLGQILGEF
jgi:precorrin-4 methylase